jgi:hypothetical protein
MLGETLLRLEPQSMHSQAGVWEREDQSYERPFIINLKAVVIFSNCAAIEKVSEVQGHCPCNLFFYYLPIQI